MCVHHLLEVKRAKKNSGKKDSSSAGKSRKSDGGDSESKSDAKSITMKQRAKTRGVSCLCCGENDDSPDPLEPEQNRFWGYHVLLGKEKMLALGVTAATLITEGNYCWFCVRVWNSIYQTKMSLTEFRSWIGKTEANNTEYNSYLHWLIHQMSKKFDQSGIRKISLKWPTPWALSQQEVFRIRWVKPVEEFMELAAYKKKHGDPAENGDTITQGPGGVPLVKMKCTNIWAKKTEIISDSVKSRSHVSADADEVDAAALELKHRDLFANANAVPAGSSSASSILPGASGDDCYDEDEGSWAPAGSSSALGKAKAKASSQKLPVSRPPEEDLYNKMSGHGASFSAASPTMSDDVLTLSAPASLKPSKEGEGLQGSPSKQPAVPKSKAKAKVSAGKRTAPGGTDGDKSKKKGRPSRASDLLLRASLREFASSDASFDKYFGAEWTKSTSRNWCNYITDVTAMIAAESDTAAIHELEITLKQGTAARAVLAKMRSSGTTSIQTARVYMEKVNYLAMEPYPADNPFPVFVRLAVHCAFAEAAWPAEKFFAAVTSDVLARVSGSDDVSERQKDLISGKIMSLVQEGQEGVEKLQSFCAAWNKFSFTVAPTMSAAMDVFQSVILFDKSSLSRAAQVRAARHALESAEPEMKVFVMAMEQYRSGRKIVEEVRSRLESFAQDDEQSAKLGDVWAAFDPLGSIVDVDLDALIGRLPAESAKLVISAQDVAAMRRKVFDSFRFAVEQHIMVDDETEFLRAARLLQQLTLFHQLHDTVDHKSHYQTLIEMGIVIRDLQTLSKAAPDVLLPDETVVRVLSGVQLFAQPVECVVSVLNKEGAEAISSVFKEAAHGDVHLRCVQEGISTVAEELACLKELATALEGTSLFEPGNKTRMQQLSSITIPDGVVAVFSKLQVLPGCDILLKESLYLHALSSCLKTLAQLGMKREQATSRSSRHVSQDSVNSIMTLRLQIGILKCRIEDGLQNLFITADVSQMLQQTRSSKRLGVAFNTTYTQAVLDTAHALVKGISAQWASDLTDLGEAMTAWMVPGIRIKLTKVLDAECKGRDIK